MPKSTVLTTLAVLVLVSLAQMARAEHRVALIIGNAAYENTVPLDNTVRDAELTAAVFQALGFETLYAANLNGDDMRRQLAAFRVAADGAEVAAIYFAGHGFQFQGGNFVMPVDVSVAGQDAVLASSLPIDALLAAFPDTAESKWLMLDACRDPIFSDTPIDALSAPGLARLNHTIDDLLVLYAAQPNHVALDGAGQNGPFAAAMAAAMTSQDEVMLSDALVEITERVRRATGGLQLPYVEGTLSRHLVFTRTRVLLPAVGGVGSGCAGRRETYPLEPREESLYVSFDRPPGTIETGPLRICPALGGGVRIEGPNPMHLTCEAMRDTDNQGVGYKFQTVGGKPADLWFHVDPDSDRGEIEFGITLQDTDLFWISTGWQICT